MAKEILPILPVKDNLLVVEVSPEVKSPGGIVLVPNAKLKAPYRRGLVLAIGPGLNTEMDNGNSQIPETIKVGTEVFFHQAAGWDIKIGNDTFINVSWRQVECIGNPVYSKE